MTFAELYAALYARRPVSRERICAALRQIVALPSYQHDCWVEYRNRRLEARHV